MASILKSTLNTRFLPTGNMKKYVRSDYPGKLTDDEVDWLLKNNITTIVDLREEKEYIARPCRLENEEGFIYYHMPVTGGGDTPESPEAVGKAYLGMLDEQMDNIINGNQLNISDDKLFERMLLSDEKLMNLEDS